jgi:hypothetical protein
LDALYTGLLTKKVNWALMPTPDFPQKWHENQSRVGVDSDRPQLDLVEEASVMTSPATAIKTEIRELINLQIQVFGHPAPLTSFELEDCRRRAERIKSLGRELDQVGIAAIQLEGWRRAT